MSTEARHAWIFDFGADLYAAVGGLHLAEYLHAPEITAVPFAPPHARGVLVWRERLVPLIALADLAGSTEEIDSATAGVIVLSYRETPQSPLCYGALTLASAPREIEVHDDMACEIPADPAFWSAIAASCINYENRLAPILRVSKIFTQTLTSSSLQNHARRGLSTRRYCNPYALTPPSPER